MGTGIFLRTTRSSSGAMQNPLPASTNGGDVAEAGSVSVIVSETPVIETAAVSYIFPFTSISLSQAILLLLTYIG